MKLQTRIPGLVYIGLTEDYRVIFEKDGKRYTTSSNLGQLKTNPSILECTSINSKAIGPRDVMIFKKEAA